jgi:hypothetical protein
LIKTLNVGEPIDYPLINALINRINQLDSADRLSGLTWDQSVTKYTTSKDNISFQAFKLRKKVVNSGGNYYGSIGKISYPQAFAATPIVVVTFQGDGAYLVPYVKEVNAASFELSVARLSQSFADPPTAVTANIIAMGPTKIN